MNDEGNANITAASRRMREGILPGSATAAGRSSFDDNGGGRDIMSVRSTSMSAGDRGDRATNASASANSNDGDPNNNNCVVASSPPSPPSAADPTEYVDLHELAKGWKAALGRCSDPRTRREARAKNDRGNLPLHTAASFRAPVEVIEGLLEAYPEAASLTNNYGNLALHFTAWKKGPVDCMRLLLQVFPEGAAQRNNHGNLPLHYAAHYNAPMEVVEALYRAYPEAANQKNNDSNTPLDLAVADGASPNVVALLQGKAIPPSDEEIYQGAKSRYERVEKEMARQVATHDTVQDDLRVLLDFLMDVRENHPSAMYSSGIDPALCGTLESLMDQVSCPDLMRFGVVRFSVFGWPLAVGCWLALFFSFYFSK